MTCHHIPSVRCPECSDDRPSMGYWPVVQPCGDCAALREENARLRADMGKWQEIADKRGAEVARLEDRLARLGRLQHDWQPHEDPGRTAYVQNLEAEVKRLLAGNR